ncbi:DUF6665 family protein [Mesorhizobium sp. PUT5]|uniref:DUF6665 family protein n=1 Tax=Mesorhizobium sp. PUT5 TaxID=3454629 RepID=UPI003FA40569
MSLRPPSGFSGASAPEVFFDALGHEILAEKASALGRAGARAESALARLRAHQGGQAERRTLLADTADAVYAWFIQRELCGFRRHDSVIREFSIPPEVLVRLGAK